MSSRIVDSLVLFVFCVASAATGVFAGSKLERAKAEEAIAVATAKQGAKDYEKLARAIDAHEATQSYLDSVRAESNRMRKLLTRREAELAKLNAGAGVAGCEGLLRDGVELLGSCRERLLECASRHDALIEFTK